MMLVRLAAVKVSRGVWTKSEVQRKGRTSDRGVIAYSRVSFWYKKSEAQDSKYIKGFTPRVYDPPSSDEVRAHNWHDPKFTSPSVTCAIGFGFE